MAENSKIPEVPKIVQDRLILPEEGENLLGWKQAFEDIGCTVYLEGENAGTPMVAENGSVMDIHFSVLPSEINLSESGYGEASLYLGGKADVYLEACDAKEQIFDKLEKELKSPIKRKMTKGNYLKIFLLVLEYQLFKRTLIPLAPQFQQ